MHVVGSLGAMAAVIASTVLIKQHSVLDIFAAIPYAAVVYGLSSRLIHPTRRPGRSTAK